ncbi:hypothetical protein [Actinacidiphila oryziradicis]|uniref:hypothetical protein n=1 Tax=Actinacidiphila oryziradicis TaxID=2571141 RepID=UPI0038996C44
MIVVARTSTDPGDRRAGLTLLVVEDGTPGFTRGRVLNKMGIKTVRCATSSMASCPAPTRQRLRGRPNRWGGVACRWAAPGGVVVGRRRSASPPPPATAGRCPHLRLARLGPSPRSLTRPTYSRGL